MRVFLLIFIFFYTLEADKNKEDLLIGAGLYIQSQPYKGVDTKIVPSPVVFFDNSILYMRWSGVGIYFLGDKNDDLAWGFSLTAQPRVYGYKSSDIEGMGTRNSTLEGGLAFHLKKDSFHIETMLLTDILDRYDSWIAKGEIGFSFKAGEFSFYPSFVLIYESSKFLNYYYGVKKSEELGGREEYTPRDGLMLGVQTYINYPITKKISTLINLRVDRLSNEASASPIVEDRYIYSGLLSLIYSFKY